MNYEVLNGLPYPLGAGFDGKGVNFAIYSSNATRVQLCLFNKNGTGEKRIDLPQYTDEVFHGYIKGLKPGQLYGYRVYGPYEPEKGHRFNHNKLLIDPYARQVTGPIIAHNAMLGYLPQSKKADLSFNRRNSAPYVPKCIVVDDNAFKWQFDKPKINWDNVVIYEAHLKGFTAGNPKIDAQIRGTCAGMSSRQAVEYIKSLGITSVELLPIASFMTAGFLLDKGLTNYWGYDPIGFMAPHAPYLSSGKIDELKHMVEVFHEAGVEVILDVVYNHTFDIVNSNFEKTVPGYFYRFNSEGKYADASGCGNETASDRAMMRKYMIQSVLHWVNEYHIDGFRFDLMGIHDIETMNEIRAELNKIDPTIFVYGEGWAAGSPQMPQEALAMKANAYKMPGIAVFCDEMRDGLRGPFNDDKQGAFLTGLPNHEMSIMYGLVGCIPHPQIINDSVNYSKKAWAAQPTQLISYSF